MVRECLPMIQKGKWLDNNEPDDPVSRAARHALSVRLELVEHYLPLAADRRKADTDTVHQLRVATRRACAAITSYAQLLPPKRTRWLEKRLKRIRQATGDARDCDVLAARLEARAAEDPKPAWKTLAKRIEICRRDAQAAIERIERRLRAKHFHRRVTRLVRKVEWRDESSAEPAFLEAARSGMRAVLEPFFSAGENLSDTNSLHEFRILGKQLRYAMELFASAFDSSFRDELYPMVEELQEKLGEINDHAAAIERCQHWIVAWEDPTLEEPVHQWIATEEAALVACQGRFHQWWAAERVREWRQRFGEFIATAAAEQVA